MTFPPSMLPLWGVVLIVNINSGQFLLYKTYGCHLLLFQDLKICEVTKPFYASICRHMYKIIILYEKSIFAIFELYMLFFSLWRPSLCMTVSRFRRVPEWIFTPFWGQSTLSWTTLSSREDSGLLWKEVGEDENREPCGCDGWRSRFSGVEKWNDSCTGKGKCVIEAEVLLMVGHFSEDYLFIPFP